MSFGQRLATVIGELVMKCSTGKLWGFAPSCLCLCSCRLVVLRACETAGHPSSDEMRRCMGKNQFPQRSLTLTQVYLSVIMAAYNRYSCHQQPSRASCQDDGVKRPCLQLPPPGWLMTAQGCNRPASAGCSGLPSQLMGDVGPLQKALDKYLITSCHSCSECCVSSLTLSSLPRSHIATPAPRDWSKFSVLSWLY